jgi:uncharacterized membrane protein
MTFQDPAGSGLPPTPPPPPPPPPAAPAGAQASSNRSLMVVLAYLWLLALVPLLTEKDDREVQWHAKHGLVLFIAEIAAWAVYWVVTMIPGVGCLMLFVAPVIALGFIVLRVVCIMKGVNGERFIIPGVSEFADKF